VLGFIRGDADNSTNDRILFGLLRGTVHPTPKTDLIAHVSRGSERYHECDDHDDHGVLLPA
jgi:hypothetical protein